MGKKKQKVEFRYYEMEQDEIVLALLGNKWVQEYGVGIDNQHFHNFMEVGYCHYGQGTIFIDENSYRFSDEMLAIIPANHPHTTNSDPGTKAHWSWIYIDVDKSMKIQYQDNRILREKLQKKITQHSHFLKLEKHQEIQNIMRMLIHEEEEKKSYYRENVKSLVQMFFVELLRLVDDTENEKKTQQKVVLINEALEYVHEYYMQELKISDLADACGMSESYFRKLFGDIMNMKPNDYINMVRIQMACELIQKTELAMEEIAYRVGFINSSTFNRNFRKILDISPYQWKKSPENHQGKLMKFRITAQKGW